MVDGSFVAALRFWSRHSWASHWLCWHLRWLARPRKSELTIITVFVIVTSTMILISIATTTTLTVFVLLLVRLSLLFWYYYTVCDRCSATLGGSTMCSAALLPASARGLL